jgi:hypothetical protein
MNPQKTEMSHQTPSVRQFEAFKRLYFAHRASPSRPFSPRDGIHSSTPQKITAEALLHTVLPEEQR